MSKALKYATIVVQLRGSVITDKHLALCKQKSKVKRRKRKRDETEKKKGGEGKVERERKCDGNIYLWLSRSLQNY